METNVLSRSQDTTSNDALLDVLKFFYHVAGPGNILRVYVGIYGYQRV